MVTVPHVDATQNLKKMKVNAKECVVLMSNSIKAIVRVSSITSLVRKEFILGKRSRYFHLLLRE